MGIGAGAGISFAGRPRREEPFPRDRPRSLPSFVELDDLEGFGRIGLIEASRRFDSGRGILFKTFAYYRIRGAIYDGIRKMAWFAQAPDPGVAFQAGANEILCESSGSEETSRGGLGLAGEMEGARSVIETIATARLLSLNAEPGIDIADRGEGPLELTEIGEYSALLRSCVGRLPDKERSVIEDYYFHHLSLEESGAKIGLSKSWTSRLHARALKSLARLCQECGLEAAP
jgi:RNA polymerase sigma factor for flagellar operon FliA